MVFSPDQGYVDLPVTVGCGKCWGCRVKKTQEWAVRCVHEASLHEENSYLTLTYNNENLPKNGSLSKGKGSDLELFFKRLRRWLYPKKIRYYACGEYGGETQRPHYHVILFGYQFKDLEFLKYNRHGQPLFKSEKLEERWDNKGFCTIGAVTVQSAAYVARYCTKKLNGDALEKVNPLTGLKPYERFDSSSGEIVTVEKEFSVQSTNPGIAMDWLKKHKDDIYQKDYFTIGGKKYQAPKFYDQKMEEWEPGEMAKVRARRKKYALENPEKNSRERLEAREALLKTSISNQNRGL